MRYLLIVILTWFTISGLDAQNRKITRAKNIDIRPFRENIDFGFSLGSSHYSGEIANKPTFSNVTQEARGQFAFEFNYNASKYTSIGINVTSGTWYANDFSHLNLYNRSWYGKSIYTFPSLIFRQKIKLKKSRFVPYLEAGFGFHIHDSKSYRISDDRLMVNPGIKTSVGLSGGIGVEYDFNRYFDIFLRGLLTYHVSDDVDNLIYSVYEPDKIGFFSLGIRATIWERKNRI